MEWHIGEEVSGAKLDTLRVERDARAHTHVLRGSSLDVSGISVGTTSQTV
jgi:hypothetical protein